MFRALVLWKRIQDAQGIAIPNGRYFSTAPGWKNFGGRVLRMNMEVAQGIARHQNAYFSTARGIHPPTEASQGGMKNINKNVPYAHGIVRGEPPQDSAPPGVKLSSRPPRLQKIPSSCQNEGLYASHWFESLKQYNFPPIAGYDAFLF